MNQQVLEELGGWISKCMILFNQKNHIRWFMICIKCLALHSSCHLHTRCPIWKQEWGVTSSLPFYWVLTHLLPSILCQTFCSVPDPSFPGGDGKAAQPRSSPSFRILPSVSLFMCESWCCAGEAVPRVSWASVRQRRLSLSPGAVACSTGGVLKKLHVAASTRCSCCMMGAYTPVAPTAAVSWATTSEDAGQVTDINWTYSTAWFMTVTLQNLKQTFRTR